MTENKKDAYYSGQPQNSYRRVICHDGKVIAHYGETRDVMNWVH